MNPLLVVRATIARHLGTYVLFILLVAVATAIGVAITAQETALRTGSARAADKFDLVIAAPGSQTDVVMAAIYLRPGTVPLLDSAVVAKALAEPHAKISAPLGFGDNIRGAPIVGTVAAFVDHLSGGLEQGRVFAAEGEAVVGAASDLAIGGSFRAEHGMHHVDDADGDHPEHPATLTVVGRMKPTGTPWDNSVIVPIEFVWRVHGLPTGHPEHAREIGPPFDPDRVPGAPAIVIKPDTINAARHHGDPHPAPAAVRGIARTRSSAPLHFSVRMDADRLHRSRWRAHGVAARRCGGARGLASDHARNRDRAHGADRARRIVVSGGNDHLWSPGRDSARLYCLSSTSDGCTDLAVSDAAIHSGKHASMPPRHCSRVAPRISSTASAFWRLRTLNKIRKGLSRSVMGR